MTLLAHKEKLMKETIIIQDDKDFEKTIVFHARVLGKEILTKWITQF